MRRLFGILSFTLLITFATEARAATYFPTRPQGASMHTLTGVLTWFGRGNDSGAIVVKDSSGAETDIYMARTVSINGVTVRCTDPQSPNCKDWPTGIVIGTTVVTVSYWIDPSGFDGRRCYVSDQVDAGARARVLSHKR